MFNIGKEENKIYQNFTIPSAYAVETAKNEDKTKKFGRLGGLIGISLGVMASIALTRKNQPKMDIFVKDNVKQTLKNLYNYTKIDYEGLKGYKCMLLQSGLTTLGSLTGGLLADKNKENKKSKFKEALFVFNNVLIPTAFAKATEFFLDKKKTSINGLLKHVSNNKFLKNLTVLLGVAVGLLTSISVSNTINTKIIEPEDDKKKKIKITDLLVHIDDVIPVLISGKDSIVQNLPIDRAMPFIYYLMGRKTGESNYYTER